MSWYYSYYLGTWDEKNKILDTIGMYDDKGELHYILSDSRSFASDLYEYFDMKVNHKENLSDRFINDICGYKNDYLEDEDIRPPYVTFCKYDDLPFGNYIKKGYYLIDDIIEYEKEENIEDLFYDYMSPSEYIMRSNNEKLYGKPDIEYDIEGEPISKHSCGDYSYYCYVDYNCKEYDISLIKNAVNILFPFGLNDLRKSGKELVVICIQG